MQDQLRAGILSTAAALGIDPLDLATAISYETAGTFDPTKAGPRTKWGRHKGLIQFGEPQAQKYGVDWSNPIGSQLGPKGAVANYLRDTGVQPGMGMLDIYSAINAGGVGPQYHGRSDTAAGGAPGTVRDKVEGQMAGHRQKAQELLGAQLSPEAQSFVNNNPQPGGFGPGISDPNAPQPPPGPSMDQPFGTMAPMMASAPIPSAVADYANSKDPKPFGERLAGALSALGQTPEPPRISPMGSPGDTGNALLKYLADPNAAADMLLAKRMRGVA